MKKIVYFDEESATDYLQIFRGGNLEKTTELLRETTKNADVNAGADVGVNGNKSLSGFFSALLGFNGSIDVKTTAGAGIQTSNLAKSILQNTILTDFLDNAKKDPSSIIKFNDYKLEVEKDSLTYIVMISPFMSMISGSSALDEAEEYDLAIDKVDETLKLAKGYYEFVGQRNMKKEADVIFRFNINAFKNNYRITDIRKMDLIMYAVQVGSAYLDELKFNNEFELKVSNSNPYFKPEDINNGQKGSLKLKVFDVLLAGVE